jgi:hypothetical protein
VAAAVRRKEGEDGRTATSPGGPALRRRRSLILNLLLPPYMNLQQIFDLFANKKEKQR